LTVFNQRAGTNSPKSAVPRFLLPDEYRSDLEIFPWCNSEFLMVVHLITLALMDYITYSAILEFLSSNIGLNVRMWILELDIRIIILLEHGNCTIPMQFRIFSVSWGCCSVLQCVAVCHEVYTSKETNKILLEHGNCTIPMQFRIFFYRVEYESVNLELNLRVFILQLRVFILQWIQGYSYYMFSIWDISHIYKVQNFIELDIELNIGQHEESRPLHLDL